MNGGRYSTTMFDVFSHHNLITQGGGEPMSNTGVHRPAGLGLCYVFLDPNIIKRRPQFGGTVWHSAWHSALSIPLKERYGPGFHPI